MSSVPAEQTRLRAATPDDLDAVRALLASVLLTTTAEDWFPRFGFVRIARDAVPAALHASAELRGACPASAAVMQKPL